MFMRNMKARAEKQWMKDAITIYLFEKLLDGRISLLSNLEFTTIDPMVEVQPSQSIDLPITTAQELMDELWSCGLRPSEGSGSAGSLKATETHLKDMQDFSRRLLGIVETRLLTQRAAVQSKQKCPSCKGMGTLPGSITTNMCLDCMGTGISKHSDGS